MSESTAGPCTGQFTVYPIYMTNARIPATLDPAEMRRRARLIALDRHLCTDEGAPFTYWITVHGHGATLSVRGISRIDGQAKTHFDEL